MTYAERILADGAAAYWRLNEASGTSAADSAGTHPGAISGGVTLGVPGVVPASATAMSFDGTGRIDLASFPPLGSAFTLELWAQPTADAPFGRAMLNRRITADGDFQWGRVGVGAGALTRFVYASGTQLQLDHPVEVPLGSWAHFVVTGAAGQITQYCNGVAGPSAAQSIAGAGGGAMSIGAYGGEPINPPYEWIGALSDVAMYPRALTAADVLAHYNAKLAEAPPGPAILAFSSDVDTAILQALAADPALRAACPDGVYWDLAMPGASRFVVVSQVHHADTYVLGGTAWESFVYLVQAVMPGTSAPTMDDAARAIHTVLQDNDAISIPDYKPLRINRVRYIRYTERDDETDQLWQHRGGQYQVLVAPVAAALPRAA